MTAALVPLSSVQSWTSSASHRMQTGMAIFMGLSLPLRMRGGQCFQRGVCDTTRPLNSKAGTLAVSRLLLCLLTTTSYISVPDFLADVPVPGVGVSEKRRAIPAGTSVQALADESHRLTYRV